MRHPSSIKTPDATFLALNQPLIFGPFFAGYLDILHKRLPQFDVISTTGEKSSYYTCGHQDHYRGDPNWKPWQHLEAYCDKSGFGFFEARGMIFERIGRKLICECELLRDEDAIRRRDLETFGVDFGEPGRRDLDIF